MNQKLRLISKILLISFITGFWLPSSAQVLVANNDHLPEHYAQKNAPLTLKQVITELSDKYKVKINFDADLLNDKKVEQTIIKSLEGDLDNQLKKLLKPYNLKFEKFDNDSYAIFSEQKKNKEIKKLSNIKAVKEANSSERINVLNNTPYNLLISARKDIVVKGKVREADGQLLPGVNVLVKGTSIGTTTDLNGEYTIKVPDASTSLIFSFIGYTTEEVQINERTIIDISLLPDVKQLTEVVVVGYGTQEKRDVTGAIGSIKQEELEKIPAANFEQALQGRVSGVQVTTNSGRPGGDVAIRIRGIGTINNNDPLYVIDGIPVYTSNSGFGNPISTISPNDIKSIEILKDASATAIYGARAANGVVIVTTKRGSEGKATLSYDGYYGVQEIAKRYEVLNAEEFALFSNEMRIAQKADPLTPEWSDPQNIPGGIDTDWQDQVLQNAPMQNHNLSISGGGNGIVYSFSGNYMNQEGIIKGSDFTRFSLRTNLDATISDRIKLGTSLMNSRTNESLEGNGGILDLALRSLPTIPVRNSDGTFGGPPGVQELYTRIANPVGLLSINEEDRDNNRFLGNIFLDIELLKGLRIRPSYSIDNLQSKLKDFNPQYIFGVVDKPSNDLSISQRNELIQTFETNLTYENTFAEKHKVSAVAVYSVQESKFEVESQSTNGLVSVSVPYMDAATGDIRANGAGSEWAIISYTARANYAFLDKYLISGTIRRDGSSRFGKNNRWAIFPAFSVGWRLGDEGFLDGAEFISDLKLRGSWGKSGNQEIGLYGFAGVLNNDQRYVFGQNQAIGPGVAPTSVANPDLKWETTTQTNIGLDAAFFENKLEFSANYYVKNTEDMLVRVPIPNHSGITEFPFVNAGSMENRGWEFSLGYRSTIGDINYNVSGNLSYNQNELTSLGTGQEIISGSFSRDGVQVGAQNVTITRVGDPVGSFYGWQTNGLFQTPEEVEAHATQNSNARPGDVRFVDINDDDRIDGADRVILGNPLPDLIFGLNGGFNYKGLDVSLFFQGVAGNEVYNGVRVLYANSNVNQNYLREVLGRWQGVGTSNEIPRAILRDTPENGRVSDRWVEDGSFVRLKNLTVGYTLPSSMLSNAKIQRLRVYLAGTNLLTFTNYSGIDPEIGENNSVLFSGIDQNIYPVARTYTLGVNLSF